MAKILIVEDSNFQRKRISAMVVGAGHEVITAEDGKKGVEMALSESPECVLTDLLMPEMDGFGLLETLGASEFSAPIIVVTSDIQDSSKAKCLALGAVGFVCKPPKPEQIVATIASALEGVSVEQ